MRNAARPVLFLGPILAAFLWLACTAQVPPTATVGLVDHHVHLLGPDLLRDWKAIGATFSQPDEVYLSAERVLGSTESSAVGPVLHAVLVPMAHFYGSEELRSELGLSVAEEHALASRENDHVAREAARYPGRAVALCSVSALRPYAREELVRCREKLGSAGVKLHLASSGVDLRNEEHLAKVAEIAAWAEHEGLPILLHLDPQRRGTHTEDVERFARMVIEPHPHLTMIVAHLGGSGGYGPWTRSVYRTLTSWLAAREQAGEPRRAVYFDLSAVVLEKESEGVPATTPEEAAALASDLRAVGFDRLLFGSDYPVFAPKRTAEALGEIVGLTKEELGRFVSHTAPGLFDRRSPLAPAEG